MRHQLVLRIRLTRPAARLLLVAGLLLTPATRLITAPHEEIFTSYLPAPHGAYATINSRGKTMLGIGPAAAPAITANMRLTGTDCMPNMTDNQQYLIDWAGTLGARPNMKCMTNGDGSASANAPCAGAYRTPPACQDSTGSATPGGGDPNNRAAVRVLAPFSLASPIGAWHNESFESKMYVRGSVRADMLVWHGLGNTDTGLRIHEWPAEMGRLASWAEGSPCLTPTSCDANADSGTTHDIKVQWTILNSTGGASTYYCTEIVAGASKLRVTSDWTTAPTGTPGGWPPVGYPNTMNAGNYGTWYCQYTVDPTGADRINLMGECLAKYPLAASGTMIYQVNTTPICKRDPAQPLLLCPTAADKAAATCPVPHAPLP